MAHIQISKMNSFWSEDQDTAAVDWRVGNQT